QTLGDALLTTHRSYLPLVRPLLATGYVKGMAHITGGGITDNLPRVLPDGTMAVVDVRSWTVPPVFEWLQQGGGVPKDDMLRTFNMGIGLIIVTGREHVAATLDALAGQGERAARVIGEITAGDTPAV